MNFNPLDYESTGGLHVPASLLHQIPFNPETLLAYLVPHNVINILIVIWKFFIDYMECSIFDLNMIGAIYSMYKCMLTLFASALILALVFWNCVCMCTRITLWILNISSTTHYFYMGSSRKVGAGKKRRVRYFLQLFEVAKKCKKVAKVVEFVCIQYLLVSKIVQK